jgi:hypothetical protein
MSMVEESSAAAWVSGRDARRRMPVSAALRNLLWFVLHSRCYWAGLEAACDRAADGGSNGMSCMG